jgi:GxxExxY protein
MLRIPSPLPEEIEAIVHQTIGCCIAVHRALGPGLLEHIYAKAVCLELVVNGIHFEREKRIPVIYRGERLCDQYIDFIVAESIVLEIKSVEHLAPIHHSQLLNYLRLSHLRAGLLVNFNVVVLKDGINRKVL